MNEPERPDDDRELERFAQRFEAARPELSDEAMARIEGTLHREVRQVAARRNVRRLAVATVGLAACVLVAIGLSSFPRGNDPVAKQNPAERERTEEPTPKQPPAVAEMIEDRFEVAISIPHNTDTPSGPLVSLKRYQSLIGDTP